MMCICLCRGRSDDADAEVDQSIVVGLRISNHFYFYKNCSNENHRPSYVWIVDIMKLLLITLILGASISIERHVIEANGAAQYIGPCDVSFCSACFVFCGVPPYTCKAKITAKAGVISPCEIDPICEVCQDLCPKEIGDAGCPAHACPR